MLHTGERGVDWSGLPLACARYGITDVQGLIDRLVIIKSWRKPGTDDAAD